MLFIVLFSYASLCLMFFNELPVAMAKETNIPWDRRYKINGLDEICGIVGNAYFLKHLHLFAHDCLIFSFLMTYLCVLLSCNHKRCCFWLLLLAEECCFSIVSYQGVFLQQTAEWRSSRGYLSGYWRFEGEKAEVYRDYRASNWLEELWSTER